MVRAFFYIYNNGLYLHFLEKRIKESAKILENAMKKGETEIIEANDEEDKK